MKYFPLVQLSLFTEIYFLSTEKYVDFLINKEKKPHDVLIIKLKIILQIFLEDGLKCSFTALQHIF